jgi:N-acetylglutamate synthase
MTWAPPDLSVLFTALDQTWPAAEFRNAGPWCIRKGLNGGKRVSCASQTRTPGISDLVTALDILKEFGQQQLFMVRGPDTTLDAMLCDQGFSIIDPVELLVGQPDQIARYDPHSIEVIEVDQPMPILAEIWLQGGIGPGRLQVMQRSTGPSICFMGRLESHPVGAAFAACHNGIAMVHAVEVLTHVRRKGLGLKIMGAAASWAARQGADTLTVLVLSENLPAISLYKKMGMEVAGRYHYRIRH